MKEKSAPTIHSPYTYSTSTRLHSLYEVPESYHISTWMVLILNCSTSFTCDADALDFNSPRARLLPCIQRILTGPGLKAFFLRTSFHSTRRCYESFREQKATNSPTQDSMSMSRSEDNLKGATVALVSWWKPTVL